ncbi:hypothetical protein [uncultured Pelagimonas sp.]|uniref:hypothetical protein n=1 Tax=uncultured Pelagimonas sp. TaxID=1618102 RepID=UPI0026234E42|nr:hypothetical protein [uncultured Pelagimonas sp.]
MPRMLLPVSPLVLLTVAWVITIAVAVLPFLDPERFDIALLMLAREQMTVEDFTWKGASWLILAYLVFAMATFLTRIALPQPGPFRGRGDINRAARVAFATNLVFLGVTLLWVYLTARQVGGIRALIVLVQLDALEARETLLNNKLFKGMRVIYASLPATGTIAATLLAVGARNGNLGKTERLLCLLTFGFNLVVLILLPIVMSQRLLLLQLIMAAYFSTCMVHRRLVGLQYLPIGFALFMTSWIGREAITNASIQASALEIGFEKLVFYFSNDLLNSFMPFNREFEHTHGYFSFKFAMFFTQTEDYFRVLLADSLSQIDNIRGGGEWSVFTTPYVDFGAVGAALYIAGLAIISRIAFHKGFESVTGAAIYGQFAGAYALSTHSMYFAQTNFVAMIIVLVFVGSFAKERRGAPGLPEQPPSRSDTPVFS